MILSRAALALLALAASTAATDRTYTLAEMRAMTPDTLKSQLLGEAGAIMRETEVRNGGGGRLASRPVLTSVDFAATPRSAGFKGLCEADTISVRFGDLTGNRSSDPPVRIRAVNAGKAFAILPDFLAMGDSDSDWDRLESACAKAWPVLIRWEIPARRGFFSGLIDNRASLNAADVNFAMRALTAARGSRTVKPVCLSNGSPICTEAAGLLATPDWRRLAAVMLKRCDDMPANWCVELWFDQTPFDGSETVIEIATSALRTDSPADVSVRAISFGEISGGD